MIQSLAQKYNKAIPRYTSYPPVPQWNNQLTTQNDWLKILSQDLSTSPEEAISVYLHLPFCETLCTYCGCNKRITKRHELEEPYIQALKAEWDIYSKALSKKPLLKYLHLGGGTPTFFSAHHLAEVISYIIKDCELVKDYSFSFEGHPNNTTYEQLRVLNELGFNRVSYGIQDFSLEVQTAIHRIQPFKNVERVVNQARDLGYESINFDLVYGLPFQTIKSIAHTIQKVALFKPERIALYSYAHVPWLSKSQRGYDESNLPTAEEKLSFYLFAKKLLIQLGYHQIGMDHFALKADELMKAKESGTLNRNFMGYTADNSSTMIGLGCSSISSSIHGFVQNEKSVESYQESVLKGNLPLIKGHYLNDSEVITSNIISDLICNGYFDFSEKPELFDKAYKSLVEFESDGLIKIEAYSIRVTEKGMLFIRNICSVFDPYQSDLESSDKKVYSQSV